MTDIIHRVDSLDETLFDSIPSQTTEWDRRALLALHSAVANRFQSFDYLEIGSYLGGSLQAAIRDPRCRSIVSVDPRPSSTPDKRAPAWTYEDNTTARMIELLARLPDADLGKLTTFDVDSSQLAIARLPARPHYCFIDGEHTDAAALRDARFCARAMNGHAVIAFHDYPLLKPAISTFLRETWSDVTMAVAFPGFVFAVELRGSGLLASAIVDRAVASRWHSVAWRTTSRLPTPRPLLAVWSAMPALDRFLLGLRTRSRSARHPRGGRSA